MAALHAMESATASTKTQGPVEPEGETM